MRIAFLLLAAPVLAACRSTPPRGPGRALLLAQAQFTEQSGQPVPGPARLEIVRPAGDAWTTEVLEDPDSNAFHKAMPWEGGFLTIGATKAMLKTWRRDGARWEGETRWNPTFGGKFDRLRDVEAGDLLGDGKHALVIATHDQGVIAIVHPDDGWRVEEIDRQPDTFVHEIELGDVDGDGTLEIFATPSRPNKLESEQPGEVRMYRHGPSGWTRSVVDAPGDTHAKEILATDVDHDGRSELFVVWEGAIGAGGAMTKPVTITMYRWRDGAPVPTVVATVPDRQMRAIDAGDVNGDGKTDLVAGALESGLWLFEQDGDGWKKTRLDAASSGFEHPVHLADLDGDGTPEIYVGAEDQAELRRYVWKGGRFERTTIAPLPKGDLTWNITDAVL
ncbi:MAG TPA: VCBS repeat-containing protein [Candidatus Binatia bacterium]|nr:VCBS repeat-containing protein [Candidatus Binatia bacterium]